MTRDYADTIFTAAQLRRQVASAEDCHAFTGDPRDRRLGEISRRKLEAVERQKPLPYRAPWDR